MKYILQLKMQPNNQLYMIGSFAATFCPLHSVTYKGKCKKYRCNELENMDSKYYIVSLREAVLRYPRIYIS